MAIVDLGHPHAPTPGGLAALPRRLTLTLPELQLVAEQAGDAPLPFEISGDGAGPGDALGARLGTTPMAEDAAAYADVLESLHDPRSSLARRGLLVDTAIDDGLLGAVGLLATPAVAVDVDVAAGDDRVRAWHRQSGAAVASLATADGIVFELAWFPTDHWADELARVAVVPESLSLHSSAVPDQVELPFELADAAGEAVRSGRSDLLSVLVGEHAGETRDAAGSPLPDLEAVAMLSALSTECRGRMRVLVADVSRDATSAIGVVSWVLVADGWRALRPRHTAGVDVVEVTRVLPGDLALELAPVLAAVAA